MVQTTIHTHIHNSCSIRMCIKPKYVFPCPGNPVFLKCGPSPGSRKSRKNHASVATANQWPSYCEATVFTVTPQSAPHGMAQLNYQCVLSLLSHHSSQSWQKSRVNYYQTRGHVFSESRAIPILHSTLFLSCPAGTTTPSTLHTPPPRQPSPAAGAAPQMYAPTLTDVCECVRLVPWSPASTMPL